MRKQHITIILAIVGSLVVLGAIGWGTFTILSRLKPAALNSLTGKNQSSQSTSEKTTTDTGLTRAEQLVKDGKLADAKAAYQTAADSYTAAGNTAAAADAKTQIAIIDAQLNSQSAQKSTSTQTTNVTPHQAGSPKK